ncbi:LysR family transcriptional regulator [Mannheimia sp. AT1]|uniref:LysR family transcriptional regulator n=1 Tax=Mannheimia cairinae TaxID=3025936 RepID=A0ABT5MS07_9PAST|nr:LysR family transcriptional regulator [Mannheimia cairinae]MDD0824825.1 LysR family transcriptional regulator [Mannheimia cairinae]MDD0826245.1 LysR family transcriptional regulator [Mannheimia cairinae]
MDKLNAISLFCKVIETQSFTQAAQQAQISLPMASKLVAQLEEHLNVRLLQRTTRKITPTEAGLLYYQHCLPILNELKEADASVSNISSTLQGKITMSVPMDFGSRFIAPYLGRFMEDYPNLELHIEFSDRRVDVIAEGFDLVLRIGSLADSSIVAKKIADSHLVLAASPTYLKKFGEPKNLDKLTKTDCLLYENHTQWKFMQNGQKYNVKPEGKIYSNNGYALVQMAKAGFGIINIPKFLIKEELNSGELVPIMPFLEQETLQISLLYPNRRYLSPKVRVLIDFFSQLMQEQQPYL